MFNQRKKGRSSRQIRRIVSYCLTAILVAIVIIVAKEFQVQELLRRALAWIDSLGPIGPVAFIIIYNLATVLFIPGALLTLGGGVIFGVIWGSIYVSIAATSGAIVAFSIGRYLSRGWACKQLEAHPQLKAIDLAVARSGFKIVFLTRLCPILPFNLLNYAFGVMQLSLKDYILGSVGMIPGTVMYVYLGALVGDIAKIGTEVTLSPQAEALKWAINIIGSIATVAVTVYVTKLAQKALAETV
ncbi:MAG: TVP38/TMEM64 family protein [Hormoscilla sp. GM7CHS1pb]|nr:TVP38/TMEM64 family protein [Hormoscilla sp. GM7CHS1pb]